MFLLLTSLSLAILLGDGGAEARPIPATSQDALVSCDDLHVRTLWSIVQGCLLTISLCTWVAAHPNLQGPMGGKFEGTLARALIAIEALLTPELVIAWSMQQWLVARNSAKEVKGTIISLLNEESIVDRYITS